jgi:beta-lactam-binding protein with PASTA domain
MAIGTDTSYPVPGDCSVPAVVGKELPAAEAAIRHDGCKVGTITRKPSPKKKKGKVLSQSPSAHKTGPKGMKVNLVVGKG